MAYPVTVIQTNVDAGDVDSNRHNILLLVASAVTRGSKLIVLPEACVSDLYRDAALFAETIPGPSTELVQRAAGDATVALPLLEKAPDGKIYSACAFIDKHGVKGVARKTHLFRDAHGHDSYRDAEILTPGSELSIIDLDNGAVRIGVLLGFDAEFPEAFRTLALRGADLIVVALNQINPDANFLSAMALRNRVPLLVANRIGFRKVYPGVPEFSALTMALVQDKDGSFLARCRGGSVIVDADGRPLAEPSQNVQRDLETLAGAPPQAIIPIAHFQQDELLHASFRIDDIRIQRLTSPFIAERREELYHTTVPSISKPVVTEVAPPVVSVDPAVPVAAVESPAPTATEPIEKPKKKRAPRKPKAKA